MTDNSTNNSNKTYTAIGLMSGTSCDGIDLAVIQTDGHKVFKHLGGIHIPFTNNEQVAIKKSYGRNPSDDDLKLATEIITQRHIDTVLQFLSTEKITVDIIGFHGQTTYHAPLDGITIQIGNAQQLADVTGIPVVGDFRSNDVKCGGMGAPLAPVYHCAISKDKNTAFLNLGGIANITVCDDENSVAFDLGVANALMDDYCQNIINIPFDNNGDLARQGTPNMELVNDYMTNKFFDLQYPKALDRNELSINFNDNQWQQLNKFDSLATLNMITVCGILKGLEITNSIIEQIVICGGGLHNKFLIDTLANHTDSKIIYASDYGLDGDLLEAEAFAFMAVHNLLNLPISYTGTTGVKSPTTGGVLFVNKS